MLTIVVYVVVTLVVAAALFALSVVIFGRGELLPAVSAGQTVTTLPRGSLTGEDLRSVRFAMAPRGYRMSEVDWALEEAAVEIDRLRTRLSEHEEAAGPSREVGGDDAPASPDGATR